MNKDVIYIDIEDDITGIIGKVKAANTKIVALVPPKRIGILQSVVNLKLLQRAAQGADKRVVLITNDHSLTTLAAGVKMPVARNLQSRPEVPQLTMPDSPEEEVINGKDLPVGDFAKTAEASAAASAAEDISDKVTLGTVAPQPTLKKFDSVAKVNGKKPRLGVPNFNAFRKRFFIFGALGVLLIIFLVWAIGFAPHATVVINAKTTNVSIQRTLKLSPGIAQSDTTKFTLKPVVQQLKKAVATEFPATGTKDIGEKAKGSVTIRNCDNSDGFTLPAGTRFTAGTGQIFTADQAVVVPKFDGSASSCTLAGEKSGKKTAAVSAADIGPDFNVAAQNYSFNGSISGKVDAVGTAMAGGSKQTVTVISQEDVEKAKQQLGAQNIETAKAELKKQFTTADVQILEDSFSNDTGAPSVSPAVGEQAKTAKLTIETTYGYLAITKADIKAILTAGVGDAIKDKADQQVYSLGENSLSFQNYQKLDAGTFGIRMDTTGAVGPKIDTKQLATQLVGKRFGEIQALVGQIAGVNTVEINMSPFWVTTAPAADKIDIKFSVAPSTGNGQ